MNFGVFCFKQHFNISIKYYDQYIAIQMLCLIFRHVMEHTHIPKQVLILDYNLLILINFNYNTIFLGLWSFRSKMCMANRLMMVANGLEHIFLTLEPSLNIYQWHTLKKYIFSARMKAISPDFMPKNGPKWPKMAVFG